MARRKAAWVGERGVIRRLSVRISTSSPGSRAASRAPRSDHAHRRLDLAAAELQAGFEPTIQVLQHDAGRLDRARLAGDRDQVAARREARRNLLLDQRQMLVMLAEQQSAEPVVVEAQGAGVDVRPRASGPVSGACRRGLVQASGATAIGDRHAARLWAWLAVIRTSIRSPGPAPGARRGPPGGRACGRPAGPDAARVAPAAPAGSGRRSPAGKRGSARASSACSSARRSVLTWSSTWPRMVAAGVPGRGLYLNENAWAKPISSTSASVAAEVGVALAGKADDEVGRQRDVGARARAGARRRAGSRRRCGAGSSPRGRDPSRTAPADAGTASASSTSRVRRDQRRHPDRADARSCSGSARGPRSRRAPGSGGRDPSSRPSGPAPR